MVGFWIPEWRIYAFYGNLIHRRTLFWNRQGSHRRRVLEVRWLVRGSGVVSGSWSVDIIHLGKTFWEGICLDVTCLAICAVYYGRDAMTDRGALIMRCAVHCRSSILA